MKTAFPAQKHIAEFIGTFGLTLMVSITLMSAPELTPFVAAMTLAIFVYTIGPISGCHINPAVTAGLWSAGKIKNMEALWYVLSQVAGGLFGMAVARLLAGGTPAPIADNMLMTGLAEAIGAAFLVFGVSSVAWGKVTQGASGVTIGGSLLLGILASSMISNGVLNPAVAIGINSISVMYIVAPLVGGVVGAWAYKWISA